ncbi:MAG: TonB-dependent receptor, partial [Flavobacteriales bacterium]|nr:TonB-dependent receptor [Flavobacteriales bacterium]
MIDNSDFYTGAFPAEYSNALGGVFDLNVRKGNTLKRQYTAEIGLNGLEVATEGPFKKGKQSTYLVNYRYSTLALLTPLLPDDAAGISYHDISFKMNFPTQKAGTFSIWGLGSMDNSGQLADTDSSQWIYAQDREEALAFTAMGAAGINHQITVKEKTVIRTLFATTGNVVHYDIERMDSTVTLQPYSNIKNEQWKYTLSSTVNHRFGSKHTLRSGVVLNYLNYDLGFSQSLSEGTAPVPIVSEKGGQLHVQGFMQSQIRLHPLFRINVGLHAQYFNFNQTYSIEPRLGAAWNISDSHTLNFGYGLHGQLEKLNFYMVQT